MGTQPSPPPLPKKEAEPGGRSRQFSAHVYCGQTAGWIKMALGIEVSPGPGHIVLGCSPPQKGAEPNLQFSAHFYCGHTAGCIKMPLGMEVGLSPGDIVLDGDRQKVPSQSWWKLFQTLRTGNGGTSGKHPICYSVLFDN